MSMETALGELYGAFERRARALSQDDEVVLREADATVGARVAALAQAAGTPDRDKLDGPPPRAIGVAMARALFSTPHVARTLGGETTRHSLMPFRPSAALADALGLERDEMEELREEVDRTAAGVLKQMRLLSWLWMRTGDPGIRPESLYGLLFPVEGGKTPQRFVRRGARLYPVFPGRGTVPNESLYLAWLPVRGDALPPLGGFQSRYVEESTLRSIQRGLGALPDEARRLLDNLVCPLPSADDAWLRRDRWRSEGWADLTGLGVAADAPSWLTLPLARDAFDGEPFVERSGDGLVVRAPRRTFDRHAMSRVGAVVQSAYADMLARLLAGDPLDPLRQSVLFDMEPALNRVLQPLLDWASSGAVHRYLAERLHATPEGVGHALDQARDVWVHSAQASWAGRPDGERTHTVQSIITCHLAVLQASLHRCWRRQPDGRGSHQRVMLMFVGSYLQSAPLSRLWRSEDGSLPPVEDVVAQWFWGTWRRSLDALGYDD